MLALDTLLGKKISTSIKVGNLWMPIEGVLNHLANFSDPLMIATEMDGVPFILRGSLSKIKIRNRYIVLVCRHQIHDKFTQNFSFELDQIVLHSQENRLMLSSNSAIFSSGNAIGVENHDIVLFDYTFAIDANKFDGRNWFLLNREDDGFDDSEIVSYIAVGYPSGMNKVDYKNSNYKTIGYCVVGEPTPSKIIDRISFLPSGDLPDSFEGMSGSPVFQIDRKGLDFYVSFSGVVTNASQHQVNFYPLKELGRFFKEL